MKYKYSIHKDSQNQDLTLIEYANLDKELLTAIGREVYKEDIILKALTKGDNALISMLRTKNMFPPDLLARRIAETIRELYQRHDDQSMEFFFDENDIIGGAKSANNEKINIDKMKAAAKTLTDIDNTSLTGGPSTRLKEFELIEAESEYPNDNDPLEDELDLFDDEDDDL
jgi:hypothetical protein